MKLQERIARKAFLIKKDTVQALKPRAEQKQILFIVGCQRSGTTLMQRIFERDLGTKTYGEFSKLSSDDKPKGIRLNELSSVQQEFESVRAPFIVLKPLVESQNTPKLLDHFEGSQALWMYREYKDVARSNLKHFGGQNGINNLQPIVENAPDNWRSEGASEAVRETVLSYFSDAMKPHDAAVLFWYARNRLYFELGLHQDPRVMLCKYSDLVTSPGKVMKAIYEKVGQVYPGKDIHGETHPQSLKKGSDIDLSPEVDALAADLLEKLDERYRQSPLL